MQLVAVVGESVDTACPLCPGVSAGQAPGDRLRPGRWLAATSASATSLLCEWMRGLQWLLGGRRIHTAHGAGLTAQG